MKTNTMINNAIKGFEKKGANGDKSAFIFKRDKNNAQALRNMKRKGKNQKLDLTNAENIIGAIAKLGYVPGSKIGLIISITCVCETFKDPELNKQFLTDGKVDFFKLAAVFPFVGTKGTSSGYRRLFSEKEYIDVIDNTGRKQIVVLGGKEKAALFPERLEEMSDCTPEDLILIGKDLEILATVLSELEIDAAKDEEKRKGMIDINDFMNTMLKQRSRNIEVIDNFKDIVSFKKGYSEEVVTELVYEFNKCHTLFDLDALFEKEVAEYMQELKEENKGKDISEEQVKADLENIRIELRDECMVVDPLFEVVELMMEAIKETLESLTTFYVNSDMKLFEGLSIDPQRDEEENIVEGETLDEAIYSIQKTAVIVYEMINNTYTYKKHMSMTKPEDLAKIGRNIIYTAGAIRGFSEQDTFLIAVDAGWYKRFNKRGKDRLVKANFRFSAVEAVFGTELKYYFNEDAMRTEANLEIPDELLEYEIFEEGAVLEFYDGQCVIEAGEEEHTILRVDDIDFTGSILLEVDEEGYVSFVEEVDQYDFDIVDYAILDSIADVTSVHNSIAPENFEALLVEAEVTDGVFAKAYDKSKLIPKKKSDKENQKFLTTEEVIAEANRVAPLLSKWENMIKSEYVRGLNFGIEQDHYYLSDSTGKGRVFGKVHDCFMQEDEYIDIYTIATTVGAIVIKKVEEVEEA